MPELTTKERAQFDIFCSQPSRHQRGVDITICLFQINLLRNPPPHQRQMNGGWRVFTLFMMPPQHTYTYVHVRTWLRVSGPVNTMCTVGKYCFSGPPGKGRARVKTLIGREKPSYITVELCARTGEIKGRERGEPVRETGRHTRAHAHARPRTAEEEKVIQLQGDRENSKFRMHSRDGEAGKVEKSTGRKNRRQFPSAFVLTPYYTLHWAQCHLVCVHACEALETWWVCRHWVPPLSIHDYWVMLIANEPAVFSGMIRLRMILFHFNPLEKSVCWEQNTGFKLITGNLCKHLNSFGSENTAEGDKATCIPVPSAYK